MILYKQTRKHELTICNGEEHFVNAKGKEAKLLPCSGHNVDNFVEGWALTEKGAKLHRKKRV